MMAWTVFCGLGCGVGISIMLASLPRWQHRVLDRIAPYTSDVSEGAFQHLRWLESSGGQSSAVSARLRAWLGRIGPTNESLNRLARQAGHVGGATQLRSWMGLAALLGCALGTAVAFSAQLPMLVRLLLPLIGTGMAAWTARYFVAARARSRCRRIEHELPTVLEFVTLSIASGEALPDALARVARVGGGDLVAEFAEVVRLTRLGEPLQNALAQLAEALQIAALSRMVAQLNSAIERGAPLVEVLRAQAADQRVQFKREQLESAGRKEIAMLVPLVFIILPVTILFAVWPGIVVLNAGF